MKYSVTLLRGIAHAASLAGYAHQRVTDTASILSNALFPTRRWPRREMGGVTIQVPSSWGEVEFEQTGPVVYNRPRRFRTDGDAVWYSSAIEIRVRLAEAPGLSHEAPMSEVSRKLPFGGGLVIAVAIANGVSRKNRRIVDRVLRSARHSSEQNTTFLGWNRKTIDGEKQ